MSAEAADVAELVASELTTNAVQADPLGPITLGISFRDCSFRITVHDDAAQVTPQDQSVDHGVLSDLSHLDVVANFSFPHIKDSL